MIGVSKNMLAILSLLVLCNPVVGGQDQRHSTQRRRIAVAERPSSAPTTLGEGDDTESGKGMKSEGKGMRSAKGKGMKSEKYADYDEYSMSMSMSMLTELGKGMKSSKVEVGKGGESSKGMKRDKSVKSSKKLKKEKNGDLGMPSPLIPLAPSTAPPTSADSISQKSKPFEIHYSPSTDVPTTRDFQELTMVTQTYLEVYMTNFFEETSLTTLDNFLTIMVKNAFDEKSPAVLAEYESNGLFSPESIFIPTRKEIDNLVEESIMQKDYLKMVQALPKSNPFSRTKAIAINILGHASADDTTTNEDTSNGGSGKSEGSSSSVKAGVAAAAAGVVVLAASLAMLRRSRSSDEEEDCNEEVQDFTSHKVSYEDATIAESVDESSNHFAHFNRNGPEGAEFEDEPLDDDDECQRITPVASCHS